MALVHTYKVHKNVVETVCVTADNKHAVSGSWDGTIRMTHLNTGKSVCKVKIKNPEAKDIATSICLTPHNKYIVSAEEYGKTIRIIHLDNSKLFCVIKHALVNCVCVTSDNKYVVSGSDDRTVQITRLDTGKLVRVIKGHTSYVTSVCVTSDNKYVVSGSVDGTVRVTRLDTGELVRVIKGHAAEVTCVCITSDNKFVVSGSNDKNIQITRLNTGEYVRFFTGHESFIHDLCVTPDNKYIVSISWSNTIRITRLDNGKIAKSIQVNSEVRCVDISPNQHNIIVGCRNGSINVLTTPKYILKRQWSRVLLWKREFKLFKQYPGLTRYIGTILLSFC